MQQHGFLSLEWMVDHEFKVAERFRHYVSLTMVSSPDKSVDLWEFFGKVIRSSDVYFNLGDGVGGILMVQTDVEGASRAVDRYQRAAGGGVDLRYAIGSYPDEQKNASHLVRSVFRRLRCAEAGERGAVVGAD